VSIAPFGAQFRPVQASTIFDLGLNLKTAKGAGSYRAAVVARHLRRGELLATKLILVAGRFDGPWLYVECRQSICTTVPASG
jgi:hypothetical protein